jgi:hypothetical protein
MPPWELLQKHGGGDFLMDALGDGDRSSDGLARHATLFWVVAWTQELASPLTGLSKHRRAALVDTGILEAPRRIGDGRCGGTMKSAIPPLA